MPSVTKLPIVVGPSAMPDTLKALLRQLLLAAGSYAAGKGWVNADNIEGIVTFVLGVAAGGWGLFATFRRKSQLVVAASDARDSVARVVPSSGGSGIGAIIPALMLLALPLGGCTPAGSRVRTIATRAAVLSVEACHAVIEAPNGRAELVTACKLVVTADALVRGAGFTLPTTPANQQ